MIRVCLCRDESYYYQPVTILAYPMEELFTVIQIATFISCTAQEYPGEIFQDASFIMQIFNGTVNNCAVKSEEEKY